MAVRWDVLKVAESLKELDRILDEAAPVLEKCRSKAVETAQIDHAPGYLTQRLNSLSQDLASRSKAWHESIQVMRASMPQTHLAKQEKRLEQYASVFGDDKARQAMLAFEGEK
ncbi:MAG: hypothetical protein WC551_08210 [Patescibacteria group bacterium]